jgi:cytochrome P450
MGSIISLIGTLPRAWIQWHKPIAAALSNLDGCGDRIKELKRESEDNMTPSVFQTALHPKPEKGHPVLGNDDLAADALVMFTAGTDTTAHAFVTGTWNLMNNSDQLHKLQESLKEAIPDPEVMSLDWSALERIDYLVSALYMS